MTYRTISLLFLTLVFLWKWIIQHRKRIISFLVLFYFLDRFWEFEKLFIFDCHLFSKNLRAKKIFRRFNLFKYFRLKLHSFFLPLIDSEDKYSWSQDWNQSGPITLKQQQQQILIVIFFNCFQWMETG